MASDAFKNPTSEEPYARATNDYEYTIVVTSMYFEDIDEFSFDVVKFKKDEPITSSVFSNVDRETLEAIHSVLGKALESKN